MQQCAHCMSVHVSDIQYVVYTVINCAHSLLAYKCKFETIRCTELYL